MTKAILGRGQFSAEGLKTFGKQRQCTIYSRSDDGLYYLLRWDGKTSKTKEKYSVDFIEVIESNEITDLQKLKSCYTELGIQFHEVETESGYTYINKFHAHEKKGFIMVNFALVPLTNGGQLSEFFEFDEKGKLVSW